MDRTRTLLHMAWRVIARDAFVRWDDLIV
eukprot:SAG22_NODE_14911_length_361_cov_4.435115_1_plen_28_part_01